MFAQRSSDTDVNFVTHLPASTAAARQALRRCAIIDIETTGLDPHKDHIIEIAVLRVARGEVLDTFSSLVKPPLPIPEFITRLTGISDQTVSDAPAISTVEHHLSTLLKHTNPVLVGHNVDFDLSFIDSHLDSLNLGSSEAFCTARYARALLPRRLVGRYRLDRVAAALNTEHRPCHRALDDAWTTFDVLRGLAAS